MPSKRWLQSAGWYPVVLLSSVSFEDLLFCLNFAIYLSINITLKYLNKLYSACIFEWMFNQSQVSVILPYCLVYVMFDVFTYWSEKIKTYCLTCIHVPEMNISKSWQWNQSLKETKSNRMCHKCLNLLLATTSSIKL